MLDRPKAEEILVRGKRGYRYAPAKFVNYFVDALALINKGWCQGAYARSRKGYKLESAKSKHAASFDALGALERTTPEFRDFKVARTLLGYALGTLPSGRTSIGSVNDFPEAEQAKAEIVAGYRMVIETLSDLCRS